MMVEHMSKMEGIQVTDYDKEMHSTNPVQEGNDKQQSNENHTTDEESKEKSCIEINRDFRIDQATERVRKSDMSTTSLTFENYMTSLDRPPTNEEKTGQKTEDIESNLTQEMTKNIFQRNEVSNEDHEKCNTSTLTKNRTLKDIMKENYVINGESDSDDSDSSEDAEQNKSMVSEKGDGFMTYKLRNAEEIKNALKATSVKSNQTIDTKEVVSYNGEFEKSTKSEIIFENINALTSTEDTENQEDMLASKDSEKTAENRVDNNELNSVAKELTVKKREESSDSSDDEKDQYYRKLDKSDATKLKQIENNAEEENIVKTREEIKEKLIGDCQTKAVEEQDTSYREILQWNLKVPDQNVQILLPIQRKQSNVEDELEEILEQTEPKEKSEFEITPPKDIAEENDKIMYPTITKESICSMKYTSMFTESGKTAQVKPPHIHKVLKLSQNYPVFQKAQDEVIKNEVKEESEEPENSLVMCNKISEVRSDMAQFAKNLEEFNERSRLAREEVIKDYNTAVEEELKIVEKLMRMKEHMFDKRYTTPTVEAMKRRKPGNIDENVLRKHFQDMDMILEEESDSGEEELKAAIEKINKKYFKDMSTTRQPIDGEYVLSKVPKYNEDEKKDESKGTSKEKIVPIDNENFEECLTTNEDEEKYEDISKEKSTFEINEDGNDNNTKESSESCDEYFTTNEDDFEEYYEANNIKQEEGTAIRSPEIYQQFIMKLEKQAEEDTDDESEVIDEKYKEVLDDLDQDEWLNKTDKEAINDKYKDYNRVNDDIGVNVTESNENTKKIEDIREVEDKQIVTVQYIEKDADYKSNIELKHVIKRTVNCSLEMQLAKKPDEGP